jgi:predicted metal-binding membrane protein
MGSLAPPEDHGPRGTLSSRDRRVVWVGLGAVTAMAWAYMLYDYWRMQDLPMSQMWMPPSGGPWSLADLWFLFLMWAVMMAAMMTPSVFPVVTVFVQVNRRRRAERQPYAPTFLFLAGYLLAWIAYSAGAALLQWPLHGYSLLTPMMDNSSRMLAAAVLLAAGAYQWTPWKDACLHRCRTPLGFLMTEWREGAGGAVIMGLRHGGYCIGCCWALMLVLFAVGVMNMLWMALITVFVLIEKVLPGPPILLRSVSGGLLVGWGLWLLIVQG